MGIKVWVVKGWRSRIETSKSWRSSLPFVSSSKDISPQLEGMLSEGSWGRRSNRSGVSEFQENWSSEDENSGVLKSYFVPERRDVASVWSVSTYIEVRKRTYSLQP